LFVWSLITVTDGAMRVWHFNGVITTYGKRDCRNSWRYASLAVNRGAIKRSFTVHTLYIYLWNKSFFENHLINLCSITVQKLKVKHDAHNANSLMNISFNLGMMSFLGNTTVVSFICYLNLFTYACTQHDFHIRWCSTSVICRARTNISSGAPEFTPGF
jgi:hypothetical protein